MKKSLPAVLIFIVAVAAILIFGPPSKTGSMNKILLATSMQPIAFYGELIDQNSTPVPFADVTAHVEISRAWMQQDWESFTTKSDGEGKFTFTGLHGQSLVISIRKDGYDYRGTNIGFHYSALTPEKERFIPDQKNPVIFKLWKKQPEEPLISGSKFFGIRADGTPYGIDLSKGEKHEGQNDNGDLVVSITQPAQIAPGKPFQWSYSIRTPHGGIVDAANDQYMKEAPPEGYVSEIADTLSPTQSGWSKLVRKSFFLKSQNKERYAAVCAEIIANYQGQAVFSIEYVINPRPADRNLEGNSIRR